MGLHQQNEKNSRQNKFSVSASWKCKTYADRQRLENTGRRISKCDDLPPAMQFTKPTAEVAEVVVASIFCLLEEQVQTGTQKCLRSLCQNRRQWQNKLLVRYFKCFKNTKNQTNIKIDEEYSSTMAIFSSSITE